MTEEEIRYERNERRKELESERDYYNAYYYGYANLPTCKQARHLYYMQYRDSVLAYMKRRYHINKDRILAYNKRYYEINKDRIAAYKEMYYQMKKKKDYFMKKGFLNKYVRVHECIQLINAV